MRSHADAQLVVLRIRVAQRDARTGGGKGDVLLHAQVPEHSAAAEPNRTVCNIIRKPPAQIGSDRYGARTRQNIAIG